MPDRGSPLSSNAPRPMNREESVRAIHLGLAAEHKAVDMRTIQTEAARDPVARKVLLEIADEKRVHAGELFELRRRRARPGARSAPRRRVR
jgi:rubrerythrin